jgi:pimeloyl-ACP methyl ester carboxylesterase
MRRAHLIAFVAIAVSHASAQQPSDSPPASVTKPQVAVAREGAEVLIDGPGGKLAGTLLIPKSAPAAGKPPAVVFITGSGPQDRDETIFGHRLFEPIALALAEDGIASLRCDDRGVGGSTGDLTTATTHDFAADTRAQIEWLRTQGQVDPSRIGVIGHSEGALIGTLLCASDPPACSFAVLLAPPAISGRDLLGQQSKDIMLAMQADAAAVAFATEMHGLMMTAAIEGKPEPELREAVAACVSAQLACNKSFRANDEMIASATDQGVKQMSSPWMRVFLVLDPQPSIARIGAPTLVLFGERDLQVGLRQNLGPFERAAERAPVRPVIEVVPGVNHLFQRCTRCTLDEYARLKSGMDPDVVKKISKWVAQTAGVAPPSLPAEPASSR